MEELEVQHYPGWQHAMDKILERINEQGHGVFFSHEELKSWMSMEEPKDIDEYKKHVFQYLNSMDNLRTELLEDHRVYLDNKRGEGYIAAMPDDQVTKSPDQLINKARNIITKASSVLSNVKEELLSLEAQSIRLQKCKKVAFIKQSFIKRTLPEVEERKQITIAKE
jgi:hypothetical protein